MSESLDGLITEIIKRGWIFAVESGDADRITGTTGSRYLVHSYNATVTTPHGEARWEAFTPLEALSLAFEAVAKIDPRTT